MRIDKCPFCNETKESFVVLKPNGTGFVLKDTKLSLKYAEMEILTCGKCGSVLHMEIKDIKKILK